MQIMYLKTYLAVFKSGIIQCQICIQHLESWGVSTKVTPKAHNVGSLYLALVLPNFCREYAMQDQLC